MPARGSAPEVHRILPLAIFIETSTQAYHFTQTVDDPQLSVFHSGNDHVKAV
jgi:hypothetical protein